MIESLRLQDFRCIPALGCELSGGLTAFVGPNAQGKTSILEAICVLLRLQSPRARGRAELVRFGTTGFGVAGTCGTHALKITGSRNRRELWLDEAPVARTADYLRASGLVVWMGSEDRELVRGPGEARRRYLDFLGGQLSSEYRLASRAYDRALRSRNALLRSPVPDRASIEAYTALLIRHGESIIAQRGEVVSRLAPLAAAGQRQVSGTGESLALVYRPNAEAGALAERIGASWEADLRRGMTLAGPHRDDFAVLLEERPAGVFASEGQQRTTSIALKLAQFSLLAAHGECLPVLLIDDVFGELDPGRRNALLAALPADSQKLVTTTHLDWADESIVRPAAVYRVAGGRIALQA